MNISGLARIIKVNIILFAYGGLISVFSFLFILFVEYSQDSVVLNNSISILGILRGIIYCLSIAILEEILFRYLFLNSWIKNKNKPFNKRVLYLGLISSLVFGFLHLNLDEFPLFQINLTFSGISMFYATYKFRNVSIAIGMHFFWNLIQGVIFPFQGSGSGLESFFIMENEVMVYPEGSSYIVVSVILEIIIITLLSWVHPSFRDCAEIT
jgi:hypothetical protein